MIAGLECPSRIATSSIGTPRPEQVRRERVPEHVGLESSAVAYYSDRERGPKPRTSEELTPTVWKAIWGLIRTRVNNGAFGIDFPEECTDGRGPYGTNEVLMEAAAHGDAIVWPISADDPPEQIEIFDMLEFCDDHVSEPVQGS